ncbi:ACT domain-containing protein ACR6-like [Capsicum annuum]|uniref:ACT domain-containing protein ACR6-like n=1 Tax=Capsicum annuum TaxID=4072 RepID=UPI001FB1778A|nr:ACT domain-containing protein ACR6-like [Capsicum annuum]
MSDFVGFVQATIAVVHFQELSLLREADLSKKTLLARYNICNNLRKVDTLLHTSIELRGTDRPGLLSEVCAVFADLHWNVANTAIWTRNARAAAVVHVVDDVTDCAIEDPKRLAAIKKLLRNVLYGNNDLKTAQMTLSSPGFTHRERKLHQIMFADRDYIKVRRAEQGKVEDLKSGPCMTIYDCSEKDYNVITMRSRDRPKLLFDIVCSLTDMQYVVFHGVVHTGKWKLIRILHSTY